MTNPMDVYVWGIVPNGQSDSTVDDETKQENRVLIEEQRSQLRKLNLPYKVSKAVTEQTYSLILCTNGELYQFGVLFDDDDDTRKDERDMILLLEGVVDFECSTSVVFAKKANEKWYALSSKFDKRRETAQTGVSRPEKCPENIFAECDLINPYYPVLLSAGDGVTWFVTENNAMYGLGQNKYNVLGSIVPRDDCDPTPRPCIGKLKNQRSTIIKIDSGFANLIVLLESGVCIGCGYGYHGELGFNSNGEQSIPEYIPFTERIPMHDVFTRVFHTLWLSKSGDLYFSGESDNGQITAVQSVDHRPKWVVAPEKLNITNIVSFCCGDYVSFICTEEKIYFSAEKGDDDTNEKSIMRRMDESGIEYKKCIKPSYGLRHGTFCVVSIDVIHHNLVLFENRRKFIDIHMRFH
jgi:alpha-tubulin suppressor-like RCC1 family protein